MSAPKRIQLRRTKGWRKPEGAVNVARPTKWGNPYRVGDIHPETWEERTAEEAVALYRHSIEQWWPEEFAADVRRELRGKDLACWCRLDQPCHADVLLELANAGLSEDQEAVERGRHEIEMKGSAA